MVPVGAHPLQLPDRGSAAGHLFEPTLPKLNSTKASGRRLSSASRLLLNSRNQGSNDSDSFADQGDTGPMNNSPAVSCLAASIVLTLASAGCGASGFLPPPASVTSTPNPLVAQYNIAHFHQGLTAWVEFGTDTNYG